MAAAGLKDMDVDALLALRADVDKVLAEQRRDLERQLALLNGETSSKRGRPAGQPGRTSAMKGVKVPPKYRGPDGETWAGRGAQPRWLRALLDEGHSIEDFAVGGKGGKRAAAAAKKSAAKKGRKPAMKKRARKAAVAKEEAEAAG